MRILLFSLMASAFTLTAAGQPTPGESPRTSIFNVLSYGAIADRTTLNTAALQKAIDACAAAGGGTVLFPAGGFLTGTINLKSEVTLFLAPGAVLLASTQIADYPVKHLIYAENARHIAIMGTGTIDGQGDAFFDPAMEPLPRPSPLIEFIGCQGVRVQDVTIFHAPAWTLHPKNCEDVKILGISLLNNLLAVNTDGIDIDSDRNVIIADCHIEAGDDCIVLKTTQRGPGPVQPTENVVVTNCVLLSAASALKLGTESHADFRHCLFSNCVIRESRTGIALLAKDGGTMQDIRFSNIAMTTAPKWGKGLEWPIVVDLEKRTEESRLSHIADISFSDITITTKGRIMVSGLPNHPVENLSFRNITVRSTGYEEIKSAKKMRGGSKTVAANTPDYAAQPAAFIFDFVKGLALSDLTVIWPEPAAKAAAPLRYAIYGDHISAGRLTGLTGGNARPASAATLFENSPSLLP
jgi:hypothetical protein